MLTFRQDFKDMQGKLDGITASIFSSMADAVKQTLTSLANNLDNTIDNLGIRGTWNDNVSTEISGNVRTGFKSMIESCKEPACELIENIGVNSESLLLKLKEYISEWDSYQKLLDEREKLLQNEPPKLVYDSKSKSYETNDEWSKWNKQLNLINLAIKAIELAIMAIESATDSLITVVRNLLMPISSQSASSLSLSGSGVEEALDDGNKKVSNRVVNDDNTVTETYVLYDSKGNEIGAGNVKYNQAGQKIIEEYSIIQKDGSKKIASIDYSGEKAVETYSIINTDGTITQNEKTVANPKTVNEEVTKMIEQNGKTTDVPPTTTTPTTDNVTQVSQPKTVNGFTVDENKFINSHSEDKNKLRMFYNGQEIYDNSQITIKEGETIQILVKIPTNDGEQINLCRASTGGDISSKSGISQSNSVSPDRYDKNAILNDTGYYVWTITGDKKGNRYIVSQTAQYNTENHSYFNSKDGNGAFKKMCRLYVNVG